MKLPGERIDKTDYEIIPGYLYSDEHEDSFYTAHKGVITQRFQSLDDFESAQRRRARPFQEWFKSFE